jgi:hypothetical protein
VAGTGSSRTTTCGSSLATRKVAVILEVICSGTHRKDHHSRRACCDVRVVARREFPRAPSGCVFNSANAAGVSSDCGIRCAGDTRSRIGARLQTMTAESSASQTAESAGASLASHPCGIGDGSAMRGGRSAAVGRGPGRRAETARGGRSRDFTQKWTSSVEWQPAAGGVGRSRARREPCPTTRYAGGGAAFAAHGVVSPPRRPCLTALGQIRLLHAWSGLLHSTKCARWGHLHSACG